MRFISFICVLLVVSIISCKSQNDNDKNINKTEDYAPIINDIIKKSGPTPYDPMQPLETTELGIVQVTGTLYEVPTGSALYIVNENETWNISSKKDYLKHLFDTIITIEGEGTLFEKGIYGNRKIYELKNVRVIEVHDKVDINSYLNKTTELGIIQVTGVLHEGTESGINDIIINESETWYISSTDEDLHHLYGRNITIEGIGIITEHRVAINKKRHVLKVKLIAVHI